MSDPGDLHPLWLDTAPLVLASGSRTRLELLQAVGIPVEVVRPKVDERAMSGPLEKTAIAPARIAATLALAKAQDVARWRPGRITLGADQTLSFEGGLLHKPKDRGDAARQLARLSGKEHRLYAAVVLVRDGRQLAGYVGTARLMMRTLSKGMIERYLDAAGASVTSSVGGYQLERTGAHLFSRVTGDYSTILGLPMFPTLAAFRRLGLVPE